MFCPQFRRQTRCFVPFPHIFTRPILSAPFPFILFSSFSLFILSGNIFMRRVALHIFKCSRLFRKPAKRIPCHPIHRPILHRLCPQQQIKRNAEFIPVQTLPIPAVRSHAALPSRQSFSKSLCRILCPWLPVLHTNPPNRARPAPKT